MSFVQPSDIRNLAIVGHGTSGKTILAEAMLYSSGKTNRLGKIEDGTTISDYHKDEITRQISIGVSTLHCYWEDKKINFLDTPGFFDFMGDTKAALHVSDLALIVVQGVSGVETGTELVWDYAEQNKLPKFFAINMMDKENTHFEAILEKLKNRLSKKIFPFTLPINAGPGFNQVADVLRKAMFTYDANGKGKYRVNALPADWVDRINGLHEELIENIAESDDTLMEKFFDEGGLTEDDLRSGMHDAIINGSVIPLVCTSGFTNVGVIRMMDIITKYCPSPADTSSIQVFKAGTNKEMELKTTQDNKTSIQVFKTLSEAHVGELSFFRVYSGKVKAGMDLRNPGRQITERLGQIFVMNGKDRKDVGDLVAGDIGAVVKLKNTHTGDTLCSPKFEIELPSIDFLLPNISAAVVTKSKGDEDKIATGLATLHEEDPTFIFKVDSELSQTIISGQGELHLEVVVDKLKRKFQVEVDLIEPRIPYRETIKVHGKSKFRHKKQSGGAGQFAEVWMRVEPKERGSGVEFTNSLVGQNVDRVFVPSVEKGVNAATTEGALAGYRIVDLKVEFYDGKQHPVDSKDIAFQIAGKGAFKEAFLSAKPCLLEPIYEIEVKVPDTHMGDVMGDISGRRGKILGMDSEDGNQIIKAYVPQANLFRYSTTLRSITGGRAIHKEKFSHYEEVPKDFEQKIIKAGKKGDKE